MYSSQNSLNEGSFDQEGEESLLTSLYDSIPEVNSRDFTKYCTKENKLAFLDAYSQDPYGLSEEQCESLALDQFLRHGRKSGKARKSTESLQEFDAQNRAKKIIDNMTARAIYSDDLSIPLDRSQENPYLNRALTYYDNNQYLRAAFDFEVARLIFLNGQQFEQAQSCERALILCCYDAGLYLMAYKKLIAAIESQSPLLPVERVKGALALIHYNPTMLSDFHHPYNPLEILCFALAESHADEVVKPIVALLKDPTLLKDLVSQCGKNGHAMIIDALKLLPREEAKSIMTTFVEAMQAAYADAIQQLKSNSQQANIAIVRLYADMKYLLGLPFGDEDCLLDPNGSVMGIYALLQLPPASRVDNFAASVTVTHEAALECLASGHVDDAREFHNRSLQINPAFAPACLLSHVLNSTIVTLSASEGRADSSIYQLAKEVTVCFEKSKALGQNVTYAQSLYEAAKVALVVHAHSRRLRIKHFLGCDPSDVGGSKYNTICAAIKNKFKKGDGVFAEEVMTLLAEAAHATDDRQLIQAIRLCAANDKRTDVNNLLLKNARVKEVFKGDSRIEGYTKDDILSLFSEKVKKSIEVTLNPIDSVHRGVFSIFSHNKPVVVVRMADMPQNHH